MQDNNKKFLTVVLIIILVGLVVYLFTRNPSVVDNNPNVSDNSNTVNEGGRAMPPTNTEQQPIGKLKVANFTAKLEEVNTGCFADGECYVVVGGKHITALMGWSQVVVGSVQGVEGFGDLESQIGKEVEVYVQDKGDGTYTLYGNAGFYIKLVK